MGNTSTLTVSRAITQLVSEGFLRKNERGREYLVTPGRGQLEPRTTTVGLLFYLTPGSNPYEDPKYAAMLPHLQGELFRLQRQHIILEGRVSTKAKGHPGFMAPADVAEHGFEAVLVHGIYDARYLSQIASHYPRMVVLDMDTSDLGVDCVAFDNLKSAATMVQMLAAKGAKRIAYAGGPFPPEEPWENRVYYDPAARERYDGWRLGMAAAGLDDDPSLFTSSHRRDSQHVLDHVTELLAGKKRIDAILTKFPETAAKAFKRLGIMPGDIPVAGWEAGEDPGRANPVLTIRAVCSYEEMGRQGTELLVRRLAEPERAIERRLVSPRILEGNS
jgi:DNA-binding LacI/PurR family transcriptional regulator